MRFKSNQRHGSQYRLNSVTFQPEIAAASQSMLQLAFTKFALNLVTLIQTLLVSRVSLQFQPYFFIGILFMRTAGVQTDDRLDAFSFQPVVILAVIIAPVS